MICNPWAKPYRECLEILSADSGEQSLELAAVIGITTEANLTIRGNVLIFYGVVDLLLLYF